MNEPSPALTLMILASRLHANHDDATAAALLEHLAPADRLRAVGRARELQAPRTCPSPWVPRSISLADLEAGAEPRPGDSVEQDDGLWFTIPEKRRRNRAPAPNPNRPERVFLTLPNGVRLGFVRLDEDRGSCARSQRPAPNRPE